MSEYDDARKVVRSQMRGRGRATDVDPDEALERFAQAAIARGYRKGLVEGVIMAAEVMKEAHELVEGSETS